MSDRRQRPWPCIGTSDGPCPHDALVPTRYAKRCKSCAAKVRLEGRDMAAQLEKARGAQIQKRFRRHAEKIGLPVKGYVDVPPQLPRVIRSNGFSIAEASREVYGDSKTLDSQIRRGRVDDAALFVLSEMFGEVVA